MGKGYGNVAEKYRKYFDRIERKAGPHDPKNVRQQELAREEFEEDETATLQEVYVVVLKTQGQDTRIGPVYFTRAEADTAVEEFLGNNSYSNAWWVLRHGEAKC